MPLISGAISQVFVFVFVFRRYLIFNPRWYGRHDVFIVNPSLASQALVEISVARIEK
jgi:hypothetical protein